MYEYLIAYIHSNGHGRTFIKIKTEIKCQEDVIYIEKEIEKISTVKRIAIVSFQLLRFVEDEKDISV